MAFWRFGFSNASSIDSLLSDLPSLPPDNPPSIDFSLSSTPAAVINTLESLLDEDDILQECKTSSNPKLAEFLARRDVASRLLRWALDGIQHHHHHHTEEEDEDGSGHSPTSGHPGPGGRGNGGGGGGGGYESSGEMSDDGEGMGLESMKRRSKPSVSTPATVISALANGAGGGMAGEGEEDERLMMDPGMALGKLEVGGGGGAGGGNTHNHNNDREEDEDEKRKRLKFPHIATEILCMDLFPINEMLFNSSHPSSPSHPHPLLTPFWNAVLDRKPEVLAMRSVEVGRWVRVNGAFLQQRTEKMLLFIQSIPNLIPRLLTHLPNCSPISDLLFRILYTESSPAIASIHYSTYPKPTPSIPGPPSVNYSSESSSSSSSSSSPSSSHHPHPSHPRPLPTVHFLSQSSLIPLLTDLLNPLHYPPQVHAAASEFLRLTIAFENALVSGNPMEIMGVGMGVLTQAPPTGAPAASGGGGPGSGGAGGGFGPQAQQQQQQQQQQMQVGLGGGVGPNGAPVQQSPFGLLGASGQAQAREGERVRWPSCGLVRELASEEIVGKLVGFMLMDLESGVKEEEEEEEDEEEQDEDLSVPVEAAGGPASITTKSGTKGNNPSAAARPTNNNPIMGSAPNLNSSNTGMEESTSVISSSLETSTSFTNVSTPRSETVDDGESEISLSTTTNSDIEDDGDGAEDMSIEGLPSSSSSPSAGKPSIDGNNNKSNKRNENTIQSGPGRPSSSTEHDDDKKKKKKKKKKSDDNGGGGVNGIVTQEHSFHSTIIQDQDQLNENVTSSLVQIISVIIDLIRKNNSDFVEQQILGWARREVIAQEEAQIKLAQMRKVRADKEGAEADTPIELPAEEDWRDPKGPSLVDLSSMLGFLSDRLGDLQGLLRRPRSKCSPCLSTIGTIEPLTFERFRICELYAELIHCSNMGLLNRPPKGTTPRYDKDGHLQGGWRSAEQLAQAIQEAMGIAGMEHEHEHEHEEANGGGGGGAESLSNFANDGSDGVPEDQHNDDMEEVPLGSPVHSKKTADVATETETETSRSATGSEMTPGSSTPSDATSMDSDSGILTREEALQVQALISSNGQRDPFNDEAGEPPQLQGKHLNSINAPAEELEALSLENDAETGSTTTAVAPTKSERRRRNDSEARTQSRPASSLKTRLQPGDALKQAFMDERVLHTLLDLFFEYPWNNFLHNVVYDIYQQLFGGQMARGLNRSLAISAFTDANLAGRILEGQTFNNEATSVHGGVRRGYMGHMNIIAEEVAKLFHQYPYQIFTVVQDHVPQPDWDSFVQNVLRPARDQDNQPLGGNMQDTSGMPCDDDDDFSLSNREIQLGEEHGMGGEPSLNGMRPPLRKAPSSDNPANDQFARYLAQQISSDLPDKFDGSDDDEDEEGSHNWLSGSGFDPRDVDFELSTTNMDLRSSRPARYTSFMQAGSDSDEDADWGQFSEPGPRQLDDNPFSNDAFGPSPEGDRKQKLTPADWNSDFNSGLVDNPFGDDDDFGNFIASSSTQNEISIPSMDGFGDFDFNEASSPSFGGAQRPMVHRSMTADDGSAMFGGLDQGDELKLEPEKPPSPRPVDLLRRRSTGHSRSSSSSSLSKGGHAGSPSSAILATSPSEPLGPAVNPTAKLGEDGKVEAMVEGVTVRVPADDIALATMTELDLERKSSRSSEHSL